MSYDLELVDKKTGDILHLLKKHDIKGGTYTLGGTTAAELNITYNYSDHYYRVFKGDLGIRTIYSMTGSDSIPILQKACDQLGNSKDKDYWKATEGNAKEALRSLIELATALPEGVWRGD